MKLLPVVERKYTKEAQTLSSEPILKSAILRLNPEKLQHSRLIEAFRQCNKCPLGAKTKVVMIGKEQKTIEIPAICSYYEKNKKECPVDKNYYISLLKDFYEVVDTPEFESELGKFLMQNILSDASMARDVEVIEKGRPGFTTNKHMEVAVKLFDSLVKLKTGGDKHLHLHQDVGDKLIDEVMGDIMPEIKTKDQKTLEDFKNEL